MLLDKQQLSTSQGRMFNFSNIFSPFHTCMQYYCIFETQKIKRNKTPAENLTFSNTGFGTKSKEKSDLCKPMNQSICYVFVEGDLIMKVKSFFLQ